MYDQGSHNSQLGRSTSAPMPPPNQQHLPGPPPRPHLQQAQHGSPAQPYQFRQGPPVGMPNNLPFRGTGSLLPLYMTAQHRPGHVTALGPQNVHHNPVGTPRPVAIPQPQSGQTLYRAPVHPPSQQLVTQNLLIHTPLPPPSSNFNSAPCGTTVNSTSLNPLPSIAPLPPANPPSSIAPIASLCSSSVSNPSSSGPSDETKSQTHLTTSEKELSSHPNDSVIVARAFSPCDSDMEMEDDIGLVDNEGVNHWVDDVKPECVPINNELDVKHLHVPQSIAGWKLDDRSYESTKVVGYSGSGVYHSEPVKSERSPANDHGSGTTLAGNGTDPPDTIAEKSTTALAEETDIPQGSTVRDGRDSFRLVADYASDENSENDAEGHLENTDCLAVPPSSDSGSDNCKVTGFTLDKLEDTNNSLSKELEIHSGSSLSCKAPGSVEFEGVSISDTNRDDINNRYERQHTYKNHAASVYGLHSESPGFDLCGTGKFSKDHKGVGGREKFSSDQPKVDEFGRLVREGASDTDSDDSYVARKNRRRRRNQSPSWSHSPSISPVRRHRRSPHLQRRKEKRRRSRSFSPRYRRSRSRSPRNISSRSRSPRNLRSRSRSRSPRCRNTSDFGVERRRWVKKRIPECFDFHRGKCYRGSSCRFLHDASNRNEDSRKYRFQKQYSLVSHGSKNSIQEEIKHVSNEVSVHGAVEAKSLERTANSHLSTKREDSGSIALQSVGERLDYGISNTNVQTTGYGPQTGNHKLLGLTALRNENHPEMKDFPSKSDNSSISVSSPHKAPASPSNDQLTSMTYPNLAEFQQHPSRQLSFVLSYSKDVHGPQVVQTNFAPPSFNSSVESLRVLANQQSYIPTQPNSSLTSMLPAAPFQLPDSTVNTVIATSSTCSQFQHHHLLRRNDFGYQVNSSSYLNQLPTNSQIGGFQQVAHPTMVDQSRPPMHVLPMYNMPSQQFRGPDPAVSKGPSTLSFMASNSHPQGRIHPHTVAPVQELQTTRNQAFSGSSMVPVGVSNLSAYPYTQQQEPPHVMHHSLTSITHNHEKINISLRNPPGHPEPNKSHVVSATSTYQNPYSSVTQQPTTGMFNSDALRVEKDASYCSLHAAADGQSVVSRIATSLPNSIKAVGQSFPDSDPNQYDPLVDSIEASAKTSRKLDDVQKWEAIGDSDVILRFGGSNKQLHVEENGTKDVETVASAASVDNEEYGEDADAEVGAVESLSNSIGLANAAMDEIEIGQAKSPGKSKKSKDSRSVKLFKVALADFVKEVLRPSWRQGNMSKEAFKTIVKKTVDKVSGALKGRRMPKSREKINQYIDSSQRKLTKLVMGYVDKYVKV